MNRIVLVILVCYATIGSCNTCVQEDKTAKCDVNFQFPLNNVSADIEKLVIHSKNLKSLSQEDLKDFPELKTIDLSKSSIENIDTDAFFSNEKLEDVNLSHNNDLKIPTNGPLFVSKSVKILNLKDTGITELSEDVFSEMPNLDTIHLGLNKIEELEKALENTHQLKYLYLMKDDNIDRNILCERTSVKKIISIYYDEEENEKTEIKSCIDDETDIQTKLAVPKDEENIIETDKTNTDKVETDKVETDKVVPDKVDVDKVDADKVESDQVVIDKVEPESETEVNATENHSDFCKNKENFKFNGILDCIETNESMNCQLHCDEGMKPETAFTNPYKCFFSTRTFLPNTIPNCIPDKDLPKVESETKTEDAKIEENLVNIEGANATEIKINATSENEKDENVYKTEKDPQENEIIKHERNLLPKTSVDINETANNETLLEQKIAESTEKDGTVNGSSVVLGIIVVVMVFGAIGMGYKYWKNHRGYHNTRTEDVEEGKELKIISTNNKPLVEQNE